jgi:WD40-like Beta Propeller Repeat
MKAYRYILFALLLVLAACTQTPSPAAPTEETLTSQAVLSGATGLVYYIGHNPNAVNPYSIISHDQATDTKKVLFSGKREIQSVAGMLSGANVIISMRETTSSTSDFEIFRITSTIAATQLTTNSFDDTNVSITRGSTSLPFPYTMVWETQFTCVDGPKVRSIQVRSGTIFGPPSDSFVIDCLDNLTQPSISGNGSYIAFVRTSGSTRKVELYRRSTQTFSVIASSSGGGFGTFSYVDPSPSDDGKKVAYLRRSNIIPNPSYSIRLYNNGVTSTIVSGAVFSHPHLTADGKWLAYAQQVNGAYRIKTRNLLTNLEVDATAAASPVRHFAPFWQKANP